MIKLVKTNLYEKFSEDSDPIVDMGIGRYNEKEIEKLFNKDRKILGPLVPEASAIILFNDATLADESHFIFCIIYECIERNVFSHFFIKTTVKKLLENTFSKVKKNLNMAVITKVLKDRYTVNLNINEKFIDDSDPIVDMGIGIKNIIDIAPLKIIQEDFLNNYIELSDPGQINSIVIHHHSSTFIIRFFSNTLIDPNTRKIIDKKTYAKKLLKHANILKCFKKISNKVQADWHIVCIIKDEYKHLFDEGAYSYKERK